MNRPKFATPEEYQEHYGSMWEDEMNRDAQSEQWNSMTPDEQKQSKALAVTEQQIEKKEKTTAVEKFRKYAYLPSVQEIFTNILGNDKRAKVYVESVFIQVAARPDLQKCSSKSIIIAAAQAASLKLSVDPIMQQAHLAVYNNEVKMIPDYHGLVQMSEDTGYYEIPPNVSEVYEGEIVDVNRFSGVVKVSGQKVSSEVIGWLGYFKAKNGTERFLYMANEECDAHGQKYNPNGYASPGSAWNAHKKRDRGKMRRKTVLRTLVRRWGHFSPTHTAYLMSDEPVIDVTPLDLPEEPAVEIPETPEKTSEERKASIDAALIDLGYKAHPEPEMAENLLTKKEAK